MKDAALELDVPRRTDARGFLLRGLSGLGQALLPIAAILYTRGENWTVSLLLLSASLFGIYLLSTLFAYLRWTKLRYTVGSTEIRVESGLLERQVRSVPYDRIQDVSVTQKPLARLLGLVELTFETGAGAGEDLSLSYLSIAEGERTRRMVRDRREHAGETAVYSEEEEPELLFAMGPKRVLTLGLFRFSLVVFGGVGALLAQFDDFLPFDLWDIEGWQHRLAGPGAWLAGLGVLAQAIGVVLLLAVLGIAGVATGIVRTALAEWNFRLERTEKGFRRRRGLLTRTDVTMPVRRVQAIIVHTGAVRARFGWHALSLVSLAADAGASHHDAAPLAKSDEVAALAGETGLRLPGGDLVWNPVSRTFVAFEALQALRWWIVAAAALLLFQWSARPDGLPGWPWLAAIPLAIGAWRALRLAMSLLRTRYAMDDRQLYFASGWLAPYLTVCPREKLHTVAILQGPVGRRADYATLVLGLAGSSLQIPGMIGPQADEYRAQLLASMQRRDFAEIN